MVGLRLTILRMEIQGAGRECMGFRPVVNVEIKTPYGHLPLVGYRDTSMPLKGHGEKAVEAVFTSN